jgi:hypothetical protein
MYCRIIAPPPTEEEEPKPIDDDDRDPIDDDDDDDRDTRKPFPKHKPRNHAVTFHGAAGFLADLFTTSCLT